MSSMPLITVIVAVFNGTKTLQQCLDSFFEQTYARKEIIVIDGGSRDGTVEILEMNSENISYWESQVDEGIYDAWNKGIARARGDWICFLGADDFFWQPDVLEQLAVILSDRIPRTRIVYGRLALTSTKTGETLDVIGEAWPTAKHKLRQLMAIPHVGLMHHRSVFEEHGVFDPTFRIAGDYELLLRELQSGEAFFVEVIVAGMRTGGISSNPANTLASLREVRAAQLKNGIKRPGVLWIMAVLRVRVRQFLWISLGEQGARSVLDLGRLLSGKRPVWTKA